eukprot:13804420-Ditylum_brightwellii.AAC.1
MTLLWTSPSLKKTKPSNISSSEYPFASSSEKHTPNNIKEITGSMEKSCEFEFNLLDEAVNF